MLITRAELRRLLLAQQGLLNARIPAGAGGLVTWIRRRGFLQLDGQGRGLAAGHDLILFNRLSGYQAGDLELALCEGGQLFEHYLHVLGVLPAADYALIYDPARIAAECAPGSPGAQVLQYLAEEGPATLHDLRACWPNLGNRRAISRTVHALYTGGAILVRRHEGGQKLYDLAERVLPGQVGVSPSPDRLLTLARRALQALAPVTRPTWSQALNGIGSRAKLDVPAMKREKGRLIAELLALGEAVVVEVEAPAEWYILPANWLAGASPRPELAAPRVCFLPSLDPVLWDRQRARDLFGYQWHWDGEQRRFPGTSLAILYGEALVGQLEPQMSWPSQRLLIQALHLAEPRLAEDSGFRAAFGLALAELAGFHGAREIRASGPVPPRLLP